MRLAGCCLLLMLFTACTEKPIREGDATTFLYHDDTDPKVIYEASNRPGISISDLNDPVKMKKYMESNAQPIKPFHIQVYRGYILAFDPISKTTQKVDSKHLVKIEWKPESSH